MIASQRFSLSRAMSDPISVVDWLGRITTESAASFVQDQSSATRAISK
jgi:hypothetical protein